MSNLRLFLDTHDVEKGSFPENLPAEKLPGFLQSYEDACTAEGVISLQVNLGQDAKRAFCMTLAPDAEAVRRVHERVGLPFDSITEVRTVTPHSLFAPG